MSERRRSFPQDENFKPPDQLIEMRTMLGEILEPLRKKLFTVEERQLLDEIDRYKIDGKVPPDSLYDELSQLFRDRGI
jgi:hypothetical protein